jgi:hypothetical protein
MKWLKLLLYVPLFCTLNCEKKVSHTEATLVSKGAIEALQRYYISSLDPYSVKEGQMVHVIETQEVITSQSPIKNLSKEWLIEVSQLENSPEQRLLTVLKKVTDKTYDELFVYEFKNVYSLPQVTSQDFIDELGVKSDIPSPIYDKVKQYATDENTKIDGIAYQNLKTREVSLIPPKKVAEHETCQDIPNCHIKANLITYDIIFLFSNGKQQSLNVEWYISTEVPFFAGLLKQCTTTLVPVDKARVLVKQCSEVVDFKN